jgi:hypothetical protein
VRTVLIVLFDAVQSLDVTGPLEVFAGARGHQGKRAYLVRTASLGGAPSGRRAAWSSPRTATSASRTRRARPTC